MGSPFGELHITFAAPQPDHSWWGDYQRALRAGGISERATEIIGLDSNYIVDQGVFGAGPPDPASWPESRVRRGLVMGAVQSGKTASMVGVIARALDQKVDVIVLLAGTRTSLWLQTIERLYSQLFEAPENTAKRIVVPTASAAREYATNNVSLSALYSVQASMARRSLQLGKPFVFVAMKQVDHLAAVSETLHRRIYENLDHVGDRSPFHLLVIDDEADDSSIDGGLVNDDEAGSHSQKQIPQRILNLWSDRSNPAATVSSQLHSTYLAYTATPQANFLQSEDNPLAPADFVLSLRTPGAAGGVVPREQTYRDPAGVRSWYVGGEVFYNELKPQLVRHIQDTATESTELFGPLRSFLVASALRMARSPNRLGPVDALGLSFSSLKQANQNFSDPSCMLIHPSSDTDKQFEVATAVWQWSLGSIADVDQFLASDRTLSEVGIARDMDEFDDEWRTLLKDFQACSDEISAYTGNLNQTSTANDLQWSDLRRLILEKIVPATRIAVINSDGNADDRPSFNAKQTESGWAAPEHHSTIFVSGNVMSRGLTLEGLLTSVFTRKNRTPLADTQMQMQRWFGYRGSHLDLCRVYLSEEQYELFASYHSNDVALRQQVLRAMEAGSPPNISVLQGFTYNATGKVAGVQRARLYPGHNPLVSYLNDVTDDYQNQEIVASLFRDANEIVSGHKASFSTRRYSPAELANLLESLTYPDVSTGPNGSDEALWRTIEGSLHLDQLADSRPFYRPPQLGGNDSFGTVSPYAVAAYLRFWEACAREEDVPGLVSTVDYLGRWSMIPYEVKERTVPKFRIGIRHGSGDPVEEGPLSSLPFNVRPMRRQVSDGRFMRGSWGSRNYQGGRIVGDEHLDAQVLDLKHSTDDLGARLPGSDGMLLVMPVHRGKNRVSFAFGFGIPLGGPDYVFANKK